MKNSLSLAQREQASASFRRQLHGETGQKQQGRVLLDTCDRLELYCAEPAVKDSLFGEDREASCWEQMQGEAALRHLYRVVCGLESPLFGEKAIQGQVKQAYLAAVARPHNLSKELHRSFQSTLRVGKRVRRETMLDSGAMSHVRATWEILQQQLPAIGLSLEELAVCFIGANQLNEDMAGILSNRGITKFFLSNRNFAKAKEACQRWNGQAFPLGHIPEVVQRCQVVISATRAPHFVLGPQHILPRFRSGSESGSPPVRQPLYIFDLAVPRDVNPAVGEMDGVHLWNVTDIEARIAVNYHRRKVKTAEAEKIITEELERFYECERSPVRYSALSRQSVSSGPVAGVPRPPVRAGC
ncbi:hypothetical protein P0082_03425 [Candidatus Haliotispira prima]|uniref:Glutamyl-tRNA reductase n=1 Tax=Candidatus Haliotispira prima TaxID=3034016 RepID=A0ABY8MIX0_9SPIO|nr:hypothetical protein P0082_03425 [Candidatus Haliotispira prima]